MGTVGVPFPLLSEKPGLFLLMARFLLHLALALFPFIQPAVSAEARKVPRRYVSSSRISSVNSLNVSIIPANEARALDDGSIGKIRLDRRDSFGLALDESSCWDNRANVKWN